MLTKRSKSTNTNKPGMVTNRRNLSSRAIASSLFPSKSLFAGFPAKFFQYLDAPHKSSNSLLQIIPLSAIRNLSSKKPTEIKRQPWGCRDSKPVGLSIVDALGNENAHERSSKSDDRIVFLGSQLKVRIPSTSQKSVFPNRAMDCTHSRAEFCGRNKKSLLDTILLSPARKSILATPGPNSEPSLLYLSASDMEMSEDYTCVIFHGPRSKTTHIFDDCIIESCSDEFGSSRLEIKLPSNGLVESHSDDFLTYCHACKSGHPQGKDIFMFRGEKAYCSPECRSRQILLEGNNS